jgi:hypothetical protein
MGSMEAARRAGKKAAHPETAIMAAMAKIKLTGSKGDVW